MRDLLEQLDEALAAVPAVIPWADRDGNRVVWADARGAGWSPDRFPQVRELFDQCREIRMADVDAGWFVHPLRDSPDADPFVPREIAGLGGCFALGSDGGGGWFVVAGGGEVIGLPPGLLRDGLYEPSPETAVHVVADSIVDFIGLLCDRAQATATGSC